MAEHQVEDISNYFQALSELEKQFDEVDVEILRETTIKQKPLLEKRNAITSAIPSFWAHVFEESSSTIGFDEHVTPEDFEALKTIVEFNVTRPNAENGDPRDVDISFKFSDNEWMPEQTITKKFTYFEAPGLTGLTSTPVKITFKHGKDLTEGVNKAAIEAFEERKARADKKNKGKGTAKRGPKEEALLKLLEGPSQSFFYWFSFTGKHPLLGEIEEDDQSEGEESDISSPIDSFPYGDELAVQLAEDLYPNAVKYFTTSFEDGDDDDDDLEVDLDSEVEEMLAKQALKPKTKRNDGDSSDEPAKKKIRK